jgi:hypothetical protein
MKYSELPKRKGYRYFKQEGKKINVHKRVAEKRYSTIPEGFVIHHIDGDKDNNRKNNLILLHKKDHYRVHVKKDLVIESRKATKSIGKDKDGFNVYFDKEKVIK